jgi:purine-binding chemotaxis protein CheW
MATDSADFREYVTATVGGQMIGMPILGVQDVFAPDRIAPVPLAPAEVRGLMNLRGRIVTIIDLRVRLGLDGGERGASPMVIGAELDGQSYGLLVDAVGEVMKIDSASVEAVPINTEPVLAAVSSGVHRIESGLLLLVDLRKVFEHDDVAAAA